jgi:hypothetical protein
VTTQGKQVLIYVPDRTHVKPLSEMCTVTCCLEKASQGAVRETVFTVAEDDSVRFPRNVGIRLPTEAASCSDDLKKEPSWSQTTVSTMRASNWGLSSSMRSVGPLLTNATSHQQRTAAGAPSPNMSTPHGTMDFQCPGTFGRVHLSPHHCLLYCSTWSDSSI